MTGTAKTKTTIAPTATHGLRAYLNGRNSYAMTTEPTKMAAQVIHKTLGDLLKAPSFQLNF
jgi:hypothetical protein